MVKMRIDGKSDNFMVGIDQSSRTLFTSHEEIIKKIKEKICGGFICNKKS